ncbi:MAG: asparaginase [Anaerolineae bacterium]|nr:asparaginase [Anaerolineae bacterium]MDW8171505.1 asparaginase [Anaerolineae bacterium]
MPSFADVELVRIWRGAVLDTVHRGRVAVVSSQGEVLLSLGDVRSLALMRSSAKPFQAASALRLGAGQRYPLSAREMAIMAGSHAGEPIHTEVLHDLLTMTHLSLDALRCGADWPTDSASRQALTTQGGGPSALYHNCSGKHLGMLAACLAQGWPLENYQQADHPLQMAIRRDLAEWADYPSESIQLAVDGCTVPTFALPLERAALAFARLGHATQHQPESPLGQIGDAMRQHSALVSGTRQLDHALMEVTQGRLVSKGGAEGYWGLASPEQGWGLALKISDGNPRAVAPTLFALLHHLNAITVDELRTLEARFSPLLRVHDGQVVGRMEFTALNSAIMSDEG